MTSDEIPWLPATTLAASIRDRSLSPVEVMRAILDRIEAHEPEVNAFVVLDAESAMAQARAAEKQVMSGAELGPLHGIPVTLKDLTPTRPMRMQSGTRIFEDHQPQQDAPVATRLMQAGGIVLGKTTTSEFGWTGVSRSPLTGITHNPWKHGYNAGASSAGAGAATAAGFGPLHQGSDGAGSIRMPAHFCGVYGLKPSYGRVPYWPASVGDMTSHIGPLTRNVGDAALMLKIMAGPHPWDFTSLEAPPADYPGQIGQRPALRRIAWSADLGHARVDSEVAALARQGAEAFAAAADAELQDVTTTWGPQGPEIGRFFWAAHLSRLAVHLPEWEARMDPGLVACVREGAKVSVAEYQAMRARKYAWIADIHSDFENWDFLLTPTTGTAAFPAERLQPEHWPQHEWDWLSWAEFSYPFNMSGNPAASLPCGFTRDGLPVGLQIVGRRFDDLGVLQASALFEAERPWAQHRPPLKA